MLKDGMTGFDLFEPTEIDEALELLGRFGREAWLLAGGYDSLDWFKDRIKQPTAVIDLDRIDELRGIRDVDGGVEIGAMTTLTEVVLMFAPLGIGGYLLYVTASTGTELFGALGWYMVTVASGLAFKRQQDARSGYAELFLREAARPSAQADD